MSKVTNEIPCFVASNLHQLVKHFTCKPGVKFYTPQTVATLDANTAVRVLGVPTFHPVDQVASGAYAGLFPVPSDLNCQPTKWGIVFGKPKAVLAKVHSEIVRLIALSTPKEKRKKAKKSKKAEPSPQRSRSETVSQTTTPRLPSSRSTTPMSVPHPSEALGQFSAAPTVQPRDPPRSYDGIKLTAEPVSAEQGLIAHPDASALDFASHTFETGMGFDDNGLFDIDSGAEGAASEPCLQLTVGDSTSQEEKMTINSPLTASNPNRGRSGFEHYRVEVMLDATAVCVSADSPYARVLNAKLWPAVPKTDVYFYDAVISRGNAGEILERVFELGLPVYVRPADVTLPTSMVHPNLVVVCPHFTKAVSPSYFPKLLEPSDVRGLSVEELPPAWQYIPCDHRNTNDDENCFCHVAERQSGEYRQVEVPVEAILPTGAAFHEIIGRVTNFPLEMISMHMLRLQERAMLAGEPMPVLLRFNGAYMKLDEKPTREQFATVVIRSPHPLPTINVYVYFEDAADLNSRDFGYLPCM